MSFEIRLLNNSHRMSNTIRYPRRLNEYPLTAEEKAMKIPSPEKRIKVAIKFCAVSLLFILSIICPANKGKYIIPRVEANIEILPKIRSSLWRHEYLRSLLNVFLAFFALTFCYYWLGSCSVKVVLTETYSEELFLMSFSFIT